MLKPRKSLTKRELKEDKFVTTVFQVQTFLHDNARQLLITVGGIIVIITLIVMIVVSKKRSNAIASTSLTQAEVLYRSGQSDAARQNLESMIQTYSGTAAAGQGHHILGNMLYNAGQYDEALKHYRTYLDDYGDSDIITASCQAGVGACYEEQGNYADAATMFRQAADEHRDVFLAPEYLMSAARCFEAAADTTNAKKACQDLLERYPDSFYQQQAELTLDRI